MAHPLVFPGRYFFYPIGNTSAVSLLRDLAPEESASLLLLGCGDPRNVLYSIFSDRPLDFTCCDIDPAILGMGSSTYASFIRMGTQYTLTELRRHCLPSARKNAIQSAFTAKSQSVKNFDSGFAARSAGPLVEKAGKAKEISAAAFLNPTFVYSLGGEGCNVHYGTDPVAVFHLAALFGSGGGVVSVNDLVKTVKSQFSDWGSAFRASVSSGGRVPVIRFFASEATALCRALKGFSATGALNLGIPVAQWKTHLIQLNPAEYGTAPCGFNVVDSSNLSDHIGLLNVLIATVPLLQSSHGSVLYTESLLFHSTDATKEFANSLQADIHTVGLLLGVSPVDYLSGFSSRSDTHELRRYEAGLEHQFQQTTTWKAPTSGDPLVLAGSLPPVWDGRQLGTLLYDIYHQLFEQEDAHHFLRLNENNIDKAVAASNLIHYMRESFVLFLKLIQERFEISEELWTEVMERFIGLKEADQSLPMDSVNYQDLSAHLHLHGVHTVPFLYITQKTGPFAAWDAVPLLVRVILVVPRDKFDVLRSLAETIGTPVLHRPRVVFKEDPDGWRGESPIVVSFTMSAGLLTIEPAAQTRIHFSLRTTPGSVYAVVQRLGIEQSVFSANLMDAQHVYVLPQDPFPPRRPSAQGTSDRRVSQIGVAAPAAVGLDEECELVSRLTAFVNVQTVEAKNLFSSGAMPEISQVSPCVMKLAIGKHAQNVIYPVPVIGSQNKLRFARNSSYIEIIVPPSGPFKQGGMKVSPFPVIGTGTSLHPWNIHRLNLSSLPILNLNHHLASMMSAREYALRKAHEDDALMRVKDTVNTIFVESCGAQGGEVKRVFALVDKESNNCDTVLISTLRFDLPLHTVVCDGYVLPLTKKRLAQIEAPFGKLVQEKTMRSIGVSKVEISAWKRLLPALVERCRSWKHAETCEYLDHGVPLSDEMERDPLCSCGKGKDVGGMTKVAQWAALAPFAARVAFPPLFAVSYLEKVGRDPAAGRCFVCRGKGKPKMMKCACGKVRYCSKECQRKDWKAHKPKCMQAVGGGECK
ncbi:hypothetical protein C8R44DRAFT_837632 [Mycena epipterygia]|nr:hypothetical protein C8R44DRAFT_837632 [Mycena epipterygia]